MKTALIIVALAVCFVAGWLMSGPREVLAGSAEAAQLPHLKAAKTPPPRSEAQEAAEAATMRERVEAIYRGEKEITEEDRYSLLREINDSKRTWRDKRLQMNLLIAPMGEAEVVSAINRALANEGDKAPLSQLFGRWAELNRPAAFAFYLRYGDRKRIGSLGRSVFSEWVLEDREAAIAALDQAPADERQNLASSMIWSAMNSDFSLALDLQQRIGQPGQTHIYSSIFERWAREEPQAAWNGLSAAPPGEALKRAMSSYFKVLAETDREQALVLVESVPNHDIRENSLRDIYNQWLKDDPAAALESAAQRRNFEDLFNGWSVPPEAREAALDWAFAQMDGQKQDHLVSSILNRMVNEDPQSALAYIEGLPYGNAYRNSMSNLAREWAKTDPEAAVAYFAKMPEGKEKRDNFSSIISSLGGTDPEAARALYLKLDPRTQEEAADSLANGLTQYQSHEEALAWAETLPEALRDRVQKEIYENWTWREPSSLFASLTPEQFALFEEGDQRNMLSNWARHSPREASDWLPNIQEDQLPMAIDRISASWLDHDPYEASIWISELPEGKGRDEAVKNLVQEIRRSDPASAFDWSIDIGDESQRRRAASNALDEWKKNDPDGAYEALLDSDLPEGDIAYLVERAFKDRPQ